MSKLHRALMIESMLRRAEANGIEHVAINRLFDNSNLVPATPAAGRSDEDGERWDAQS